MRYTLLIMSIALGACTADSGSEASNGAAGGSDEFVGPDVPMPMAETNSEGGREVGDGEPHSCRYVNRFSNTAECVEFVGDAWTKESAEERCASEQDGVFSESGCAMDEVLGTCAIDDGAPLATRIFFPGDNEEQCALTIAGCTQFAGGQFTPSPVCEDAVMSAPEPEPSPIGGAVFIPPELVCMPGDSADEEVCTWQSIGGCTEPGLKFGEYAECESVLTQRPFFPVPPSNFKTPDDDPLLSDAGFLAEVAWAKEQAEACGCVCCHTTGVAPRGAAAFDTAAPGIWTDSFTTRGLAIAAGWIDSSVLGAHDPGDNNGFDRSRTGLPTTDVERMVRFFEGELARRGAERDMFPADSALGGPLYAQVTFEPEACETGIGVDGQGRMHWSGGSARYVYVLEPGTANPGVPPNLDRPDGTVWKLDVYHTANPVESGLQFGATPDGTTQAYPDGDEVAELVDGEQYYLYVLRDIGSPLTRCLFTYTEAEAVPEPAGWGDVCTDNADCIAPTDYCVKMPGAPEGYCSVNCASRQDCAGSPSDWTCNAVNCSIPALTWCGPASEIEESGGFLSVCE